MKIKKEQIEEISERLKSLPVVEKKKQSYSKFEAVVMLSKEISQLQKKGYTQEDIAAILSDSGLTMSKAMLSNYLRRAKPTSPKKGEEGSTDKEHTAVMPEEAAREPVKKPVDSNRASFTPKPDSDEI
jgi:predicted transcriptional regulator